MPGSNGFEVTEKIRGLESKWMPIVSMSAIAKDSYYEKGFAAGADYYLTKPLSETIFFAALNGIQNMFTMPCELAENQEELTLLKLHSVDSFITPDGSGLIQEINPAACSLFGYTEKELLNTPLKKLM